MLSASALVTLPLWDCPFCLGVGKLAPYGGFVFEGDMLDCVMCGGKRAVTGLKN